MKLPASLRWKSTGKTLGEGGQGRVLEVTDGANESARYALKALTHGKPAKAYDRFAREIGALKAIQHPSIISIIDYSVDETFPYYVMDFPEGAQSLRRLLRTPQNPFFGNAGKALELFISIVDALSACEAAGIIHRDLSPSNVLILPDASIRLIDFGLCQIAEGEMITLVDEGVGTPNYLAPECESGSNLVVDSRADMYSAGKILWSAIANQEAFARESPAFQSKTMKQLFPVQPSTWHLHHVFERTIRHTPDNRSARCSDALELARHIRYLIEAGYPALELLDQMCPFCGFGKLTQFEQSHCVFGNPNPSGIVSLQCNHCHICVPRDGKRTREELQRRMGLQ